MGLFQASSDVRDDEASEMISSKHSYIQPSTLYPAPQTLGPLHNIPERRTPR